MLLNPYRFASSGAGTAIETIAVSSLGDQVAGAVEFDVTGYSTVYLSSFDYEGTEAAGGCALVMQFSDDAGSTWYDGASDYFWHREEDATNAVTSRSNIIIARQYSAYDPPARFVFKIDLLSVATPTVFRGTDIPNDPGGGSNDGAHHAGMLKTAAAINRIRLFTAGVDGATTVSSIPGISGTIHVLKEARPLTVVDSWDASAGGSTKDWDLSGYSSAYLLSPDLVLTGNATARLRMKNGATVYTTAGDYQTSFESGTSQLVSSAAVGMAVNSGASTSKPFIAELANMSVAAPTMSVAVGLATDISRRVTTARNTVIMDGVRLDVDANAFSTGTVYVVGDATTETLIETITVSAMSAPNETSVSGRKHVRVVSYNAVFAGTAALAVRLSRDGGSTFDSTSGDYWLKSETGTTDVQQASTGPGITGSAGSTSKFTALWLDAVDVAVPTMGFNARIAGSSNQNGWMHLFAAEVDALQLRDVNGDSGSSGSIYITAET